MDKIREVNNKKDFLSKKYCCLYSYNRKFNIFVPKQTQQMKKLTSAKENTRN